MKYNYYKRTIDVVRSNKVCTAEIAFKIVEEQEEPEGFKAVTNPFASDNELIEFYINHCSGDAEFSINLINDTAHTEEECIEHFNENNNGTGVIYYEAWDNITKEYYESL